MQDCKCENWTNRELIHWHYTDEWTGESMVNIHYDKGCIKHNYWTHDKVVFYDIGDEKKCRYYRSLGSGAEIYYRGHRRFSEAEYDKRDSAEERSTLRSSKYNDLFGVWKDLFLGWLGSCKTLYTGWLKAWKSW